MPLDAATYEKADWYSDVALVDDPHAYFDYLRAQGPVVRLPYRNAVAVTGYEETVQLMLDTEHFSEINAVTGGLVELPFTPEGDDISAALEAARKQIDFADQIVAETGGRHADLRSILSRLFTPSRLKQLQPQLLATAEGLIDEFHADGKVDIVRQYGGPYGALVISDLLGLSAKSRARFRAALEGSLPVPMDATKEDMMKNPLVPSAGHPRRSGPRDLSRRFEAQPRRPHRPCRLPVRRRTGHYQPAAG